MWTRAAWSRRRRGTRSSTCTRPTSAGFLQASVAGDNLLNKCYELPLGGVNFDDFMASGWMSQIKPLTGRGRSFQASLSVRF